MSNYSSDSIKVLSDLDHIRTRKGMYIGDALDPSHLFSEALDNALDEVQSGYGDRIDIIIDTENNKYTIKDNGRGIPHGKKKLDNGEEIEIVELICTKSNSGGKFNNDSYKLCLTGDTKIRLADGRDISILDLLNEHYNGKVNYVYSSDSDGNISIQKISDVARTKLVNKLAYVTLDNNEVIKCTPDHRFMLRDGTYKEAQYLTPDDSLMPGYFRRSTSNDSKAIIDYDMIYNNYDSKWIYCHHLADIYNLNNGLDSISNGYVRHHKDFNKYNNNPDNIMRTTWSDHKKLHPGTFRQLEIRGEYNRIEELKLKISNSQKERYNKLSKEDIQIIANRLNNALTDETRSLLGTKNITKYNKSSIGKERSSYNGKLYGKANLMNYVYSDRNRENKSKMLKIRNSNKDYKNKYLISRSLKVIKCLINNGIEVCEENYNKNKRRMDKRWDWVLSRFSTLDDLIEAANNYNHRIISVDIKDCESTYVYDIEINSKYPNFLLSSGIFVHNSGGLHGLGMTIINALSDYIDITSVRDKKFVSYSSSTDELEYGNTKECNGTTISFSPSIKYFHTNIIPLDFIIHKCKVANAFGMTTELTIDNIKYDVTATMSDLIPDEHDLKIYNEFPVISSSKDKHSEHMELLLRYTSDTKDKYYGYTNLIYNSLGGTHVNLTSTQIISNAWEEFIKKNKIKLDVELRRSDYLVGLRCIVAVFLGETSFHSQTKEKLTTPKDRMQSFAEGCQRELVKLLCESPEISKALLKRFEEYRISQNKLLSRKEITSLIKMNNDNPDNIRRRSSIVTKLVSCTSKKRDGCELIICEGDSASSPLIRTRDKVHQSILPLRGKILNVTNMKPEQAIKSQEVCNIVNSIGSGIGSLCDHNKSMYERIIYAGDADADGAGIVNLVLSVFINMMPDLVRAGMVYIVESPLYTYKIKNETYGCDDISDIPKGTSYNHIKGLGEFEDYEVKKFILDSEHRKLRRVEYPSDIDKFNYILGTSDGKSSLLKDLGIIVDIR